MTVGTCAAAEMNVFGYEAKGRSSVGGWLQRIYRHWTIILILRSCETEE